MFSNLTETRKSLIQDLLYFGTAIVIQVLEPIVPFDMKSVFDKTESFQWIYHDEDPKINGMMRSLIDVFSMFVCYLSKDVRPELMFTANNWTMCTEKSSKFVIIQLDVTMRDYDIAQFELKKLKVLGFRFHSKLMIISSILTFSNKYIPLWTKKNPLTIIMSKELR